MRLAGNPDCDVVISILWKPDTPDKAGLSGEGVVIAHRPNQAYRFGGEYIVWHVYKRHDEEAWTCQNGDYMLYPVAGTPNQAVELERARRRMLKRAKALAPRGYLVGPRRN